MINLLTILSMLKLGMYAPAQDAPHGIWFYPSINLIGPIAPGKIGLEVGWTKEPIERDATFLGVKGSEIVYKSTTLIGLSYRFNESWDVVGGMRNTDNQWFPYASVSLRLNTLHFLTQKDVDNYKARIPGEL